jgi:hypothetical protein
MRLELVNPEELSTPESYTSEALIAAFGDHKPWTASLQPVMWCGRGPRPSWR